MTQTKAVAKHVKCEERFKVKTELELLREAAKEAKAGFDKLAFQLAELEAKKKWRPKGGGWYLSGEGKAIKAESTRDYKNFGTERATKAECEDLRKKQEWLNLTHAYACENDGVQEFFYDKENWCVVDQIGSPIADYYRGALDREKVHMTKKDAKEFARLCEEDLINFQFQGGE